MRGLHYRNETILLHDHVARDVQRDRGGELFRSQAGNMRVHHERNVEETQRQPDRYSPRLATVLAYLENSERGGHTIFPTVDVPQKSPETDPDPRVIRLRNYIRGEVLNKTHAGLAEAEKQNGGRPFLDVVNEHKMSFDDEGLAEGADDDEHKYALGSMCKDVLEAEEKGMRM